MNDPNLPTHLPSNALDAANDDARIDALVQDLPAPEVPAGFADTIVALHTAGRARDRSQRRTVIAAFAAAAIGVCAALVVVDRGARDFAGDVVADARQTVPLGTDAAMVLEAGAIASFAVDGRLGDDVIEVTQPLGRAFYRAQPSTALTVHTPGGDVVVHGTCFTVDVHNPDDPRQQQQQQQQQDHAMNRARSSLRPLATHALGAVLGATLAVVVVEGEVRVTNAQGEARASPGETITASAHAAPTVSASRVGIVLPPGAVVMSKDELTALRAAASTTPELTALVKRNAELEDKLRKADEELALTDQVRRAEEGQALPFPKDIAPRFTGAELQRSFEAAMNEAGVQGGVIDVDCSEYPCIIYGQLTKREDMDKLRESQSLSPYAKDSNSTSVWGVKKDGVPASYFGVQLAPEGEELDEVAAKRQERRMRDGWEKIKPEKQ